MTNNGQTLRDGPYTTWNTRSWGKYNGDGHLLYPHPTGPVTSIRMENWLDGLEDYEYLHLLQRRIERMESRMKLLEEELRGGINLARFYGEKKEGE